MLRRIVQQAGEGSLTCELTMGTGAHHNVTGICCYYCVSVYQVVQPTAWTSHDLHVIGLHGSPQHPFMMIVMWDSFLQVFSGQKSRRRCLHVFPCLLHEVSIIASSGPRTPYTLTMSSYGGPARQSASLEFAF